MARQVLFWLTGAATGLAWFVTTHLITNGFAFDDIKTLKMPAAMFVFAALLSQRLSLSLIKSTHRDAMIVAPVVFMLLAGGLTGMQLGVTHYLSFIDLTSFTRAAAFAWLIMLCVGFLVGVVAACVMFPVSYPIALLSVWLMRKISGVSGKANEAE